jgi:hypothetical protein
MNSSYVYRHIRLDKNEPFYIGIGSGDNYARSMYRGSKRSKYWLRIFNKTDIEVEIILDNLSYEYALEKEIEFIRLYGRSNLGNGTLCNLTDGGEGVKGLVISDYSKQISSETNSKAVFCFDLNGKFIKKYKSATLASIELKLDKTSVCACAANNSDTKRCGNYIFRYVYEGDLYIKKSYFNKNYTSINMYDLDGNYIRTYECLSDVKNDLGIPQSNISANIRGKALSACGYIFKYNNGDTSDIKTDKDKILSSKSKPINQFDLKGNFIKMFPSQQKAAKELGIRQGNIYSVLKGRYKQCNGYYWEFVKL